MVFVKQRIQVTAQGREEPSVVEERSHVYFASRGDRRDTREGVVPGCRQVELTDSVPNSDRAAEAGPLTHLYTFVDDTLPLLGAYFQRTSYPSGQRLCTA